jgi:hypothetical protein
MAPALYLTSVGIRADDSRVQVKIEAYEHAALRRLTTRPTLAITVGREPLDVRVWFDTFGPNAAVASEVLIREDRWSLFAPALGLSSEPLPLQEGSLGSLIERLDALLGKQPDPVTLVASQALQNLEASRIESLLREVARLRSVRAGGRAGSVSDAREASNRERLLKIRREWLEQANVIDSEAVAALRGSMSANPSQVALDLRKSGGAFGVKCGKEYRYPKFQFDERGNIRPEVPRIRAALGDDPQGWDTLQWFLEPNEVLDGRTPIEVFRKSPAAVEHAAQQAHWSARD